MNTFFLNSINDISSEAWNALWPKDYPFTQHAFLAALENTGCTTKETGWIPCHLVVLNNSSDSFDTGNILALMPLYQKSHSYGEYVFDWAWADAYHRNGLDYYPKLLNAIPFTPATGPRLGLASHMSNSDINTCLNMMGTAIEERLNHLGGSGFHCLFPDAKTRSHLVLSGTSSEYLERQGCQFHWFNTGYKNFDDYLSTFSSRKRKTLKKERQKVRDANIQIQFRQANEISEEEWELFYHLYQRTYFKRSGRAGYLSRDFFLTIAKALPTQILLASAHQGSTDQAMVAAALYFRDDRTLYGRYWGAIEDIDGLHFEACYYQGIEYAIQRGLQRFDPGAQGEHKIQRGFVPVITCSLHSIVHPSFKRAIAEFVAEEKKQNYLYCLDGRNYLPFKEESGAIVAPEILISTPI